MSNPTPPNTTPCAFCKAIPATNPYKIWNFATQITTTMYICNKCYAMTQVKH